MKKYACCKILANKKISNDIYDMTLQSAEIAPYAMAGQFINIYLDNKRLILPRPISICDINNENIRIIYRVVGKGTDCLSSLPTGSDINISGPVGNGFPLFSDKSNIVIVGGGIGTPPLLALTKTLFKHSSKININVILGFRHQPILVDEFEKTGATTYVATDDGNLGFHGDVVEYLEQLKPGCDIIYACGPKIMLENLFRLAKRNNTPCYISLEEHMACGVGSCLGCVTKIKYNSKINYKRICADGPVFNAYHVKFD